MTVAKMSQTTVDVLLGAPQDLEAGTFAALARKISAAFDAADDSLVEFAVKALKTYPSVPELPELDFTFEMPEW